MSLPPDQLVAALRWRYATKQFDASRKIPESTWDAIEESLVLTPSSFGLQPWKFLVVKNPAVRAKLLEESWNQPQVTDASHFVVLTSRTDLAAADIDAWISRMAEVQGKNPEDVAPLKGMIVGFAERMSHDERQAWNVRQSYIALGQLMTSAAVLGIDACPMEGISTSAYDRVLGLGGNRLCHHRGLRPRLSLGGGQIRHHSQSPLRAFKGDPARLKRSRSVLRRRLDAEDVPNILHQPHRDLTGNLALLALALHSDVDRRHFSHRRVRLAGPHEQAAADFTGALLVGAEIPLLREADVLADVD